jgi:parvulin-like peptidyl-prolyl isomerase
MAGREKKGRRSWGWRRWALSAASVAGVAAAAWGGSFLLARPAPVQVAAPKPAPAAQPAPTPSDYAKRPVAYLADAPVTREQLGEYLIDRLGVDRLDPFLNKLVIERGCREKKVEVTPAEVEAALAKTLHGMGVDLSTFTSQVLKNYHKSLYEWKEDFLRPKLLMGKLAKSRVYVTDEDLRAAFDASFGEKVEVRMIYWSDKAQAEADYANIRDDEEALVEKAKTQEDPKLKVNGGVLPTLHHTRANEIIEREAFKLQPGEVSAVIPFTPAGQRTTDAKQDAFVLKCDRRLPPEAGASLDSPGVRQRAYEEVFEQKTQSMLGTVFQELQARVKITKAELTLTPTPYAPGAGERAVAHLNDEPITREQFGEYLIARYGPEKLDLMLNRTIILQAAAAKGIEVTDAEIEADIAETGKALKADTPQVFAEEVLKPNRTSLYGWKEDVVRPKLIMDKLCAGRVTVTDADLQAAFEAYHGEKVKCRIIYWPKDEENHVFREYPKIRDSEAEFDKMATHQANSRLAATGGLLTEPIGRHTTGDDELETEIFKLQPGEITRVINTPAGLAVAKCVKRFAADSDKRPDDPAVRDFLTKQVFARKLQAEIPVVFKELRVAAKAKRLLADPEHPAANLIEETQQMLGALDAKDKGAPRPDAP